ncbi:hypothetical protein D3C72_1510050 [compost metagenome]
MEDPTLKANPLAEGDFKCSVDALLDHHAHRNRLAGNGRGHLQRLFHQLRLRHDTRHQASTLSFLSPHQATGQAQFHGLGLAHRTGQALGAAHARQHAKVDFRLAEPGIVRRQDEVTHHRQLAAAAQGKTGHRGNDRLAPVGNAVGIAEQVVNVDLRVLQLGHFLDVGTSGKGLGGTGQHHAADVRIALELVQGLVDLADDLRVQRVQRLRAVEGDQADLAVDVQQDGFECHAVCSFKDCAQ